MSYDSCEVMYEMQIGNLEMLMLRETVIVKTVKRDG